MTLDESSEIDLSHPLNISLALISTPPLTPRGVINEDASNIQVAPRHNEIAADPIEHTILPEGSKRARR